MHNSLKGKYNSEEAYSNIVMESEWSANGFGFMEEHTGWDEMSKLKI